MLTKGRYFLRLGLIGMLLTACVVRSAVNLPPIPSVGTPSLTSRAAASQVAPESPSPIAPPILTLTAQGANITFAVDPDIPAGEKDLLEETVLQSRQFFGDAGVTTVYLTSDLDALVQKLALFYHYPPNGEFAAATKRDFQDDVTEAEGGAGGIFIWYSQFWKKNKASEKAVTIAHEYYHNYQDDEAGKWRARGPVWLIEGSAEYESFRFAQAYLGIDLANVEEEKIAGTRGIADPLSTDAYAPAATAEDTQTPYTLGYLAAKYLDSEYGNAGGLNWFWTMESDGSPWPIAFEKTFGVALEDFYGRFEEYRRANFPPYCYLADTDKPFITFAGRLRPGDVTFSDQPWTMPPNIPYVFCVTGMSLGSLSPSDQERAVVPPDDSEGWSSCGGGCIVVYFKPADQVSSSVLHITLDSGRHAENTFQHGGPFPAGAP